MEHRAENSQRPKSCEHYSKIADPFLGPWPLMLATHLDQDGGQNEKPEPNGRNPPVERFLANLKNSRVIHRRTLFKKWVSIKALHHLSAQYCRNHQQKASRQADHSTGERPHWDPLLSRELKVLLSRAEITLHICPSR